MGKLLMTTIYTKPDCPFCVKAKALLRSKNIRYKEIEVYDKDLLSQYIGKEVTTVPQIILDNEYIGGYDDLVLHFTPKKAASSKQKTVFNVDNTGYKTSVYPLFLGDESGFKDTMTQPYPILDSLFQLQMSQIWNEFEIDLTTDRMDMLKAPAHTVDLVVKNIMRQHLADTIAARAVSGILLRYVTNTGLEDWYNAVALFESIHSRTYSHIIKQAMVDPQQALEEGYASAELLDQGKVLIKAFDDLLNVDESDEDLVREKLYLAIVALYLLEQVNFMSSFGITFGVAEKGMFQGIAQDVKLICRDEILHAVGGKFILKIEQAAHPEVFDKLRPQIQELFDEAMRIEDTWTDYLFSEGRGAPGISAKSIKAYTSYQAVEVAETLGIEHDGVLENPLPFMDDYIDTSKVQVAAQEMQLTAYLVNAIKAPVDLPATLADLKAKYYR